MGGSDAWRPGSGQLRLGDHEVGEAESQGQAPFALGEAAVEHLGMGEALVDKEERTFDLRPHRGALALALGQPAVKRHTPPPAGTHRHPLLDLRAGPFGTLLDTPVAGVSPGLALVAAEQPVRLRVALATLVLGQGRRRDDAAIDSCARLQPQTLHRELRIDRRHQRRTQLMTRQQAAEWQDGRLVRNRPTGIESAAAGD